MMVVVYAIHPVCIKNYWYVVQHIKQHLRGSFVTCALLHPLVAGRESKDTVSFAM